MLARTTQRLRWIQPLRAFASQVLGLTQQETYLQSRRRLLAELKICTTSRNLQKGKQLHAESRKCGHDSGVYVATALVNMYAKCGRMPEARKVFDRMTQPNVVSWTALISGYADNGQATIALETFAAMRSQGCAPDCLTFVTALKSCASVAAEQDETGRAKYLAIGRQIHSEVGCHSDIYVQSSLIDMYSKCKSMGDAHQVFDSVKQPNVVSWTALILGYAENGEANRALDLFSRMKSVGCAPNAITFMVALKACAGVALEKAGTERAKCLEMGRRIHKEAGSYCSNFHLQNTLVDMYAKCCSMVDARQVFDGVRQPDLVSWNVLISGYAENGEGLVALDLYAGLKSQGHEPNSMTFVAALKACASLAETGLEGLERGKLIHSEIGSQLNVYVQVTLIDMYAKCGSMVEAHRVFDSMVNPPVVSWNALISGYAKNGEGRNALDVFSTMRWKGCAPNSITFVCALKACTSLALTHGGAEVLEFGRRIHSEIACSSDISVHNSLIDMYAKCDSMDEARQVFDSIKQPDVVSWNSLILGYVKQGEGVTALNLFAAMKSRGCVPDCITFVGALKACCLLWDLESGCRIHSELAAVTEGDVILVTCLVDFYAKCGSMEESQKVFDRHPRSRNLRTWNALLAGYSRLGDDKAVFELLKGLQDAGCQPDEVSFLCVLTCCNHAGLVEKASAFFDRMSRTYGSTPTVEHFNCMVDILGRSNKLDDAMALVRSMRCSPNAVTWKAVLDACRTWKNLKVGRLAFKSLVSLDEAIGSAYVLMSLIYKSRGMWEEQERTLGMRARFHARVEPGQSCWTNEQGEVQVFYTEKTNHQEHGELARTTS